MAVQLDRLFAFAQTFGIPGDRKAAAGFYSGLANLPPDLLTKAFDGAINGRKDTYRLPTPAEIEGVVSEDIAIRRRVLARLEMMDRAPVDTPVKGKLANPAFQKFLADWNAHKAGAAERERQSRKAGSTDGLKPIYVANPALDQLVAQARDSDAA